MNSSFVSSISKSFAKRGIHSEMERVKSSSRTATTKWRLLHHFSKFKSRCEDEEDYHRRLAILLTNGHVLPDKCFNILWLLVAVSLVRSTTLIITTNERVYYYLGYFFKHFGSVGKVAPCSHFCVTVGCLIQAYFTRRLFRDEPYWLLSDFSHLYTSSVGRLKLNDDNLASLRHKYKATTKLFNLLFRSMSLTYGSIYLLGSIYGCYKDSLDVATCCMYFANALIYSPAALAMAGASLNGVISSYLGPLYINLRYKQNWINFLRLKKDISQLSPQQFHHRLRFLLRQHRLITKKLFEYNKYISTTVFVYVYIYFPFIGGLMFVYVYIQFPFDLVQHTVLSSIVQFTVTIVLSATRMAKTHNYVSQRS